MIWNFKYSKMSKYPPNLFQNSLTPENWVSGWYPQIFGRRCMAYHACERLYGVPHQLPAKGAAHSPKGGRLTPWVLRLTRQDKLWRAREILAKCSHENFAHLTVFLTNVPRTFTNSHKICEIAKVSTNEIIKIIIEADWKSLKKMIKSGIHSQSECSNVRATWMPIQRVH